MSGASGVFGALVAGLAGLCWATAPLAQEHAAPWQRPSLGFHGVPGLLDMPTAHPMRDADFVATLGGFETTGRLALYFQFTERLSGVFRYAYLDDYQGTGDYFDRSFDLRYQIAEEGRLTPAITVGLQDFGGTGIYSGEYLVASKTFGPLRATAGLGWGRFGSFNGFTNPIGALEVRPDQTGGLQQTGQLDADHWFRGDIGLFGGLEYQVTDRLRVAAEYSTDDYVGEQRNQDFDRASPFNFGLDYAIRDDMNVRFAYLYGTTAALQFSYVFNPKDPTFGPNAAGPGPLPVAARAPGAAADLGWTAQPDATAILRDNIVKLLEPEDIRLVDLTLRPTAATLRIRNGAMNTAQAVGRVARILTRTLPASIETFEIVPLTGSGQPVSRITFQRSDLEALAHDPDGAWRSFARTSFEDSYGSGLSADIVGRATGPGARPFTWGLGPYVDASYFDPASPVRLDAGLQLRARWEPVTGVVAQGRVRQRLLGNRDDLPESNSVVERVRSEGARYIREGETALSSLTLAHYFRPATDIYGRVTLGYLEYMHAGISGELLWKPVDSRLALGAELNYTAQRDFDQGFGLQDYEVATGHLSAYYKTSGDYHYQLDVGRYLAGDWGGTLTIDREFDNGARIGVFATLTDMPFEDFGEGSFDKGIRINIPFSALSGQRAGGSLSRTIRPVQRDGGARLIVPGRLYNSVRSWHQPGLQSQWGRFWR
jgi:hypothetical protein